MCAFSMKPMNKCLTNTLQMYMEGGNVDLLVLSPVSIHRTEDRESLLKNYHGHGEKDKERFFKKYRGRDENTK